VATLRRIPPGTILSVFPGGAGGGRAGGKDVGGGGGSGADDTDGNSGGGGGATTIAISPYSVKNLLVVGGGGGGGAENLGGRADGGGGGGGTIPEGRSGRPESGHRGHGGTLSAGGAGGCALGCTSAATSGTQLKGGNSNGGVCVIGAGGGDGSGYFGGGGAARGAGGGGSAFPRSARSIDGIFVDPEIFFNEPHAGNGDVTISYRQRFPFPWTPDPIVNFQQTLRSTKRGTPSALRFLPRWLEAGKHADLTVLAENLFGVAPEEIHSVPVKLTMMDGRITHDTR
jgi:hypothetical protein